MSVNTETSDLTKEVGDQNTDGLRIGYSATDKVGAFGATPAIQPTSANQAAVTTVAITAVTTVGSTSATPFGYTTAAQADAIVTAVNALITRQALGLTLMNALRSALVTLGWIKGS